MEEGETDIRQQEWRPGGKDLISERAPTKKTKPWANVFIYQKPDVSPVFAPQVLAGRRPLSHWCSEAGPWMEAIKLPVWQDGWEALGGLWRGDPTGGPAVMTVNWRQVVPLVSKFHRGFGPRGWKWGGVGGGRLGWWASTYKYKDLLDKPAGNGFGGSMSKMLSVGSDSVLEAAGAVGLSLAWLHCIAVWWINEQK